MADWERVRDVLVAEDGYREGYKNGVWTNEQKFSKELPGFGWSDFQAWCATFLMWGFWKTGLLKYLSVVSAGVWYLYQGGLAKGRFTEYVTKGAFGIINKSEHVFFVVDYDNTWVYTVEGNTNNDGSANGNGVYLRKRLRTSSNITGYVIPEYPDGIIISADPKFNNPAGNGSNTVTEEDDLPSVQDIMNAPLPRSGPGVDNKSFTSLGAMIAWFDANMVGLKNAIDAVAENASKKVLNGSLPRSGPGVDNNSATSVGAVTAWFDSNMNGLRSMITQQSAQIAALQAVVTTLASNSDVTLDELKASMKEAIAESVKVTGTLSVEALPNVPELPEAPEVPSVPALAANSGSTA